MKYRIEVVVNNKVVWTFKFIAGCDSVAVSSALDYASDVAAVGSLVKIYKSGRGLFATIKVFERGGI